MTDVFLTKIDGFDVNVSAYNGEFVATWGDIKLSANTLGELKELIKQAKREERRFVPLEVIHIEQDRRGRITSRVADDKASVYFTFKDPKHPEAKATRVTARLERYAWDGHGEDQYKFVLATIDNLVVLRRIERIQKSVEILEKTLSNLRKSYKDPVTWDVVNKAAGESTPESKGAK